MAVDPRDTRRRARQLERLLRRLQRRRRGGRPVPVGPDLAGLLPLRERRREFTSSLVPGYPDDTSPYAALAADPHGQRRRPGDRLGRRGATRSPAPRAPTIPAGTAKTFGDVWVATLRQPGRDRRRRHVNDGKEFAAACRGTRILGSEPARQVQRQDGDRGRPHAAAPATATSTSRNSRFTGNGGGVGIYFSPLDRPRRDVLAPAKLSHDDPRRPVPGHRGDRSTVTSTSPSGSFAQGNGSEGDAIDYGKSTDCGATFSRPRLLTTFIPLRRRRRARPRGRVRRSHRRTTRSARRSRPRPAPPATAATSTRIASRATRSSGATRRSAATADQIDTAHPDEASTSSTTRPSRARRRRPGRPTARSTPGTGGQRGVYFMRFDGATRCHETAPTLIDAEPTGHQLFPDISADNPTRRRGTLHVIWWDSRNDRVLQPGAAGRQLREPQHRAVARRVRRDGRPTTGRPGRPQPDQRCRRQPELRAVRRAYGAVRRRLPLGQLARRPRRSGPGPTGATPSAAPICVRPATTRTTARRRRPAMPRPRCRRLDRRRHLPPRRRPRPEHLRRQDALARSATCGGAVPSRRRASQRPAFERCRPPRKTSRSRGTRTASAESRSAARTPAGTRLRSTTRPA